MNLFNIKQIQPCVINIAYNVVMFEVLVELSFLTFD